MKYACLLFALVIFSGAGFASSHWIPAATVALVISTAVLVLVYMVGFGFNVEELKVLGTEELYQIIVTAFMVAMLFGIDSSLNGIAASFGLTGTFQEVALEKTNNVLLQHQLVFSNLKTFSIELGEESSKSLYCAWQGVGYNAAACSSFRALAPAVSLSMQALSVAVAELQSLQTLISFAHAYSFTLLLPAGILLRTIRLTRGAGGLFIGLAVSLYLFLPLSVLFMDQVISEVRVAGMNLAVPLPQSDTAPAQTIQYATPALQGRPDYAARAPSPGQPDLTLPSLDGICRPGDYVNADNTYSYRNAGEAQRVFSELNNRIYYYLYTFLVEGTILTVVSLVTFISALRWVSRLAGSDVDVFALARIA